MLGRRRAATTGTPPSMTTLPQGTWAPWTAITGTTTTFGSVNTRAAWSASNETARTAGGKGEAAVPQPPGRVEHEAAAILLGVDHEHPTRPNHQMIEVGLATRDGQVMQDRPPVPLQRSQQAGGASLPGCPAPPGDGLRAGPEPQPQPAATGASTPRTRLSRGASRLPRTPPPALTPRMRATRQGRLRVQAAHSAARSCRHRAGRSCLAGPR
jgi:hypothetical protein